MTDSQRYPLNLCQNKNGGVIPFSVLKLLCSLWFFKKSNLRIYTVEKIFILSEFPTFPDLSYFCTEKGLQGTLVYRLMRLIIMSAVPEAKKVQ